MFGIFQPREQPFSISGYGGLGYRPSPWANVRHIIGGMIGRGPDDDILKYIDDTIDLKNIHLFKKNKPLLEDVNMTKLKKSIKENVKPPDKNIKVWVVNFSLDIKKKNPFSIIIGQYTLTPKLALVAKEDDRVQTITFSNDELKEYNFKVDYIGDIIRAFKKGNITFAKMSIPISDILENIEGGMIGRGPEDDEDEDRPLTDEFIDDFTKEYSGILNDIPDEAWDRILDYVYSGIETEGDLFDWITEASKIGFDENYTIERFSKQLEDTYGRVDTFDVFVEKMKNEIDKIKADEKEVNEAEERLNRMEEKTDRNEKIKLDRQKVKVNPNAILPDPSIKDSNKIYETETVANADKIYFKDDDTKVFDGVIINEELNPIYFEDNKPIMVNFRGKEKPLGELTPWDLRVAPTIDNNRTTKIGLLMDNKNKHDESIKDLGGVEIQKGKFTGIGSPNSIKWININQFRKNKPPKMIIYNISNHPQLKADKIYNGDGYTPSLIVRLLEGDFYADLTDFVSNAFNPVKRTYANGTPLTAKFNNKEYQVYEMKYNPSSGYDETIEDYAPTLPPNPTKQQRNKYKDDLLEYNNTKFNKKKNPSSVYVPKSMLRPIAKK